MNEKETIKDFESRYIKENRITQEDFDVEYITMICNCDAVKRLHFAAIKREKFAIDHQLRFNTPGKHWHDVIQLVHEYVLDEVEEALKIPMYHSPSDENALYEALDDIRIGCFEHKKRVGEWD